MTGPEVFHERGVAPVLARNDCTVDTAAAAAQGLRLVRQGDPCPATWHPEAIGVVQVRDALPKRPPWTTSGPIRPRHFPPRICEQFEASKYLTCRRIIETSQSL